MKTRILTALVGGLAIFLTLGNQSSAATINQREWQQQSANLAGLPIRRPDTTGISPT